MTWIVTGGAGYIGGHVVHRLHAAGHHVVVFDDLSTGRPERLPAGVELVRGSVTDPASLTRLFAGREATGVVHLAALKSVAESVAVPERYLTCNVGGVRNLLRAMGDAGVRRVLFSSSASVYGEPAGETVAEDFPTEPANPYGETKLLGEQAIREAAVDHGVRSVVLRQFNVIGAGRHPYAADTGATNLLPAAFRALTGGPPVAVLGVDYPTPDGTAVRDYLHVEDAAEAYLRGVEHLLSAAAEPQLVVNIGAGAGRSVARMLRDVAAAAGRPVPHVAAARRPGDPPSVIADATRAMSRLNWKAGRDVADAVGSAWRAWESAAAGHLPHGGVPHRHALQ
ncbi:UDP-glucose 4-epimerase GalE [Actinoplanes sp. CA-030573]|uniref:UDP-glucose 4-epimerase GalE n=1 Tax=Actinoplanes sp. CA-030573 TaxID=3239898 RepID=UPI003D9238A7